MNDLSHILEQGQRFVEQHVPPDAIPPVVPVAIVILAVGVLVSVLGARLIRPLLTIGFAAAGGWLVLKQVCTCFIPQPVAAVIGAILAGGLGYFLHRLWVGIGAAVLLTTLALGVFGYFQILPEVSTFEETSPTVAAREAGEFALLTPDEQRQYMERSPEKWARDFWSHVTDRQAGVQRNVALIGGIAALVGLLIGACATRFALIVSTSLLGTSLVVTGTMLLGARLCGEAYRSALDQPNLLAGAGAGLLLSSLILQALLNRRRPERPTLESDQ